jgi:Ca-activated chloride channel family protein
VIRQYLRERVVPVRERYTLFGSLAPWFCVLAAASLCITALARPQARVLSARRGAAEVVILLDGSASMYVTDVSPDRWQRSVRFLKVFADSLSWQGDRVALALFSERAAPQVRLTKDPDALFFFIDHLGTHSPFRLEDSPTWDTNIEEGLRWGLNLIDKDEELFGKSTNPKAFVVISDGQAWSGSVAAALAAARRRGIPVYVVGVGTPAGALIPEPARADGSRPPSTVRAALDRDSLRQIAVAGGGEYFEIGRQPDRDIAFSVIGGVRRRAPVSGGNANVEELYWPCLLAAAIVLCLGALLPKADMELWWQGIGALIALLLLLTGSR